MYLLSRPGPCRLSNEHHPKCHNTSGIVDANYVPATN